MFLAPPSAVFITVQVNCIYIATITESETIETVFRRFTEPRAWPLEGRSPFQQGDIMSRTSSQRGNPSGLGQPGTVASSLSLLFVFLWLEGKVYKTTPLHQHKSPNWSHLTQQMALFPKHFEFDQRRAMERVTLNTHLKFSRGLR